MGGCASVFPSLTRHGSGLKCYSVAGNEGRAESSGETHIGSRWRVLTSDLSALALIGPPPYHTTFLTKLQT